MHTLHSSVVFPTVSKLKGHLPSNALVNKFEHLKQNHMRFPPLQCHRVELIIGIGQSEILRPRDTACGPVGILWATWYGVGWTIHGCEAPISPKSIPAVVNHVAVHRDDKVLNTSSAVALLKKCYALRVQQKPASPICRLVAGRSTGVRYSAYHGALSRQPQ